MVAIQDVSVYVKYSLQRSKLFKTDANGVASITDLPKGVNVRIRFEKEGYYPVEFILKYSREITQNKLNITVMDADTDEVLLTDIKDLVLNTEIVLSYSVEGYSEVRGSIIVRG